MRAILLADFGSTYTKVTAVDPAITHVIGTAHYPTTIASDIADGFRAAVSQLEEKIGAIEIEQMRACSSAAGGLRMIVSGLVEELTAEAAKLAALGAGAKVLRVFSRKMTKADALTIEQLQPDLFLLTGGTDGGNEDCILHNARLVAGLRLSCVFLIAGNRNASDECASILQQAGKEARICPNVMPKFGTLSIQPVQNEIRDLFLQRIVHAKGLSKLQSLLGDILMPTPVSVLNALRLLAHGTKEEHGIGQLMAVDLGGATCDVYSIAPGTPRAINTIVKGLPEPEVKRTVEGDIGMRFNAHSIVELIGLERVCCMSDTSEMEIAAWIDQIHQNASLLPSAEKQRRMDKSLASLALETATIRHAGKLMETYTPAGLTFIQEGKDLRDVSTLLFISGILAYSAFPVQELASFCCYSPAVPTSLRPEKVSVGIDKKYILSALGLLSEKFPTQTLRLMKKEIAYE